MSEPVKPEHCQPDSPCDLFIRGTHWNVHRVEVTGSTNDLARAWLNSNAGRAAFEQPSAWIARRQTAGKGTRNRSWASPEGGLWLSAVMALGGPPQKRLPGLGLRVGLAALRAARTVIETRDGNRTRIRWPNDLIVQTGTQTVRKLGGIVTQHAHSHVIVGIGMNVNNPCPTTDAEGNRLRTDAISLHEIAGRPILLEKLEIELLDQLSKLIPMDGLPGHIAADIRANLWIPDAPVTVTGTSRSEITGRISGISEAFATLGGLVLTRTDGTEAVVTSGTVR